MKQRISVLIALLCLGISGVAAATSLTFRATASGAQEVPPVMSETSGKITLRFDRAFRDVDYTIIVRKGVAITQAHLHCGLAGTNGVVVAFLFNAAPVPGPGGIDVNGRLARGTLTNDDLITGDCGGFEINNIASLFTAMREGLIYLNVHSEGNPPGEIRAQLFHVSQAKSGSGCCCRSARQSMGM